jgi:GTP-binding protein YchF
MQIGIVGLPLCGKSTLFQTITKTHLDPASLSKAETHQAIVTVPDTRLDNLIEIFKPKKEAYAYIEVIDVVGLHKGDSGKTQFTTNFLNNVKNVDALIQVVRIFENELVPHPDGNNDLVRDINAIEMEFILSDMAIVEKRIENVRKQIQKTQDENLKRELPILEKCNALLQEEKPLRDANFSENEEKILRSFQLVSIKPMLIAVNLDENQIDKAGYYLNLLTKEKLSTHTKALAFFGKIEQEMSELSEEEAQVFMDEYGIKESALTSIIKEAYDLLGLQSFFTVGETECHAWTVKKGSNAQEAAGEVHTDFYRKFIRAEVVHYSDFIEHGSFAKAKEHGAWRLEGKDYIVKDGDIILIRLG